ncbi:ABC transporter substrate-binding protein [Paenibacillus silvae]|nr:ABC transporter substrate-binding protein [Paenibacillus silvae]
MKSWMFLVLMVSVLISGCTDQSSRATEESATLKENSSAETGTADVETRVVQDEFGKVAIPVHPQRIVGIYVEDYLKALDITPVAQWYHPAWGVQDYLNLDVPKFDFSGSVEALMQYNPDLIIVDGGVDAAKYEVYSKVAPTYRMPEQALKDSKQMLTTIADIVGQPEKGAAYLSTYEKNIAHAKAELQKAVGDETVAVVRLNVEEKGLALFGVNNAYTGFIYSELGLTPHPMARDMENPQQILSEEAIPSLDADHIIVFPSNGTWESQENQEAIRLLDGKLWQSLPAIKNNHVYRMERSHWQSGAVIANSMKMDDLLKQMTP